MFQMLLCVFMSVQGTVLYGLYILMEIKIMNHIFEHALYYLLYAIFLSVCKMFLR